MPSKRIFRIGVDIGQRIDNSAFCLVEEIEGRAIVRLLVKYPLGTGFPLLAKTIRDTFYSVRQQGDILGLTVDATGIGRYPSEMIQALIPDIRVDAFIFTNKLKRELVGKVKVMHAFGKLKFARRKGDEIYNRTLDELIIEMKQVQAKVIREDPNNPEVEIFKTGSHDDLFTALALAIKDIDYNARMDEAAIFIPDKTWLKTPLDETPYKEVPLFFT